MGNEMKKKISNFKLLSPIQGNTINYCDFLMLFNFCSGRPLIVFTPGAKKT